MTGAQLAFSGKDSRGGELMDPFYLSEFLTIGNEGHRESQPSPIDYRKDMPTAAQLRHAYELGLVATVRRALDPNYSLTTDEQSGLRIYNFIRRGEFLGEYLQFIEIKGSPSNDFLPVEIINNPDELIEPSPGIWMANGGERIRTEIPHTPRDGKKRWTVPKREGNELVYYRHGFPVSLTDDIGVVENLVAEYIQQISDRQLPANLSGGSDGFGLNESTTFNIVDITPNSASVVFRIFDWHWHHNPYAMVAGYKPNIKNHSIGVRIKSNRGKIS